ncbi:lipid-A-disaccharide synthase [Myxococcota bacterium]|nr:lipid-A-disaccharide synthase [Myxococcota bacterium]
MSNTKKVMIIAGEASADQHGAEVVAALREMHSEIDIFGMGGAEMRAEGFRAIRQAEEMSIAGLTEVLLALPRVFRIMAHLVETARTEKPDVAVLIDMPDFNLRFAKKLKRLGIPVVYFISPQVWAWRQKRVHLIKRIVDRMLVILPFEEEFYKKHDVPSTFVGHPLIEQLPTEDDFAGPRKELGLSDAKGPIVAVLPGSRRKEVSRHLPAMILGVQELQKDFPDIQVVLPVASTLSEEFIRENLPETKLPIMITQGQSTLVLLSADAAVVTSGTATLQTALLLRPMVVVYKLSWLSYHILKRLVKVAHVALVNLIAQRELVPELLQGSFTPKRVAAELRSMLTDKERRQKLRDEFRQIRTQLGGEGVAKRVATEITAFLPNSDLDSDLDSDNTSTSEEQK